MTMTKAETLTELLDRQPHASSAASPISKARTANAWSLRRAVRARARHPVSTCRSSARSAATSSSSILANNEQFLDAFWAGMLGGIVPVPVALGISDEHRHKLLRIAKQARQAVHLHRPASRWTASARSPAAPANRPRYDALALARVLRRERRATSRRPARFTPSGPTTWRSSSSRPARPASRKASC